MNSLAHLLLNPCNYIEKKLLHIYSDAEATESYLLSLNTLTHLLLNPYNYKERNSLQNRCYLLEISQRGTPLGRIDVYVAMDKLIAILIGAVI